MADTGDTPGRAGALSEQQFERERRRAAFELSQPRENPFGAPRRRRRRPAIGYWASWLGVLTLCAVLAGGLLWSKRIVPKLHDTRIGSTRTSLNDRNVVHLDSGKYVIYLEADTGGQSLSRPHDLDVRITTSSGDPVALGDYSGNYSTGSGYVVAVAFATVKLPRDDTYTITTTGSVHRLGFASDIHVVMGVPTGHYILELVGAGLIALLAFIGVMSWAPRLLLRR